jgi:hypothetical protein
MGKGIVGIHHFHADHTLLSPVAAGGILSALLLMLDVKSGLHSKWSFLLFVFAPAMAPRALITVREDGAPIPLAARVGTSVDTVGQAGRPKSITGFQTHTTPVMLGVRDRAELADDAWLPLSSALEGVVVVRPNPDAVPSGASGGGGGAARKPKQQQQGGGAGAGAAGGAATGAAASRAVVLVQSSCQSFSLAWPPGRLAVPAGGPA